jgi:hypothetical protein
MKSKEYARNDRELYIDKHPDFKPTISATSAGIIIPIAQHPYFEKPFIKILNNFDRIIEIGTWKGGFTVFLYINAKSDCELISYEIDPSIPEIPEEYGIDLRIGDCFEDSYDEIKNLIIEPNKKVLLLCDGGDKVKEVQTFCQYLKPEDVIMCHDYADNFEEWLSYALPVGWMGPIESSKDELRNTIKEQNLKEYKHYKEFCSIFWGSFTK